MIDVEATGFGRFNHETTSSLQSCTDEIEVLCIYEAY